VGKFIPVEPEKWAEMVKAMAENARLKAEVEELKALTAEMDSTINVSQAACREYKAEVERLTFDPLTYLDDSGEWMPRHTHLAAVERLKAEVERLTSDLQMEKENEDRLVREWQKANNEVYGLQTQVAALIDDQTRLKAEVERLKKAIMDSVEMRQRLREIEEGKQS
jgi:regulator of replication initiation timing